MHLRHILDRAFSAAAFESVDSGGAGPQTAGGDLLVPPEALRLLSREAFRSISFYLRRSHLALLAEELEKPDLSANDRLVVTALLRNALIAARGSLPLCQDTGTATILGWKEESVSTGADDHALLSAGVADAYGRYNLRSSQVGAATFFDEYDTGDNLPAQIHIEALADGARGPAYRFLFVAKGGGSANKTAYFSMSKALLEEAPFAAFLTEKVRALGTAACPPYRLAVVVGGTSPEENLGVLKLATTELLDGAPSGGVGDDGGRSGRLWRDPYWERRLMVISRSAGLGAQFGGTELALDARVIRLPRHAGSCPVSIGVSCSAHRNALAVIDSGGIRLEAMEKDPASFLLARGGEAARVAEEFTAQKAGSRPSGSNKTGTAPPTLDLDQPMPELLERLSAHPVGTRLLLSGSLLVARDAAHLRWHALLGQGRPLPEYLSRYPIYYAGPADTPEGRVIGSFGPTTAQRMDGYADELMSRGASLVTLAKGNRGVVWTGACKKYGGFYLGTIGGAAALIAEENILESRIVDYKDLGMEAVRLIRVRDLIAFIVTDDKGNDLYAAIAAGAR